MAFKILKQLIPSNSVNTDPEWAKRQVWVAKLDANDTVEQFETEAEAITRKDELSAADPTNRSYIIVEQ